LNRKNQLIGITHINEEKCPQYKGEIANGITIEVFQFNTKIDTAQRKQSCKKRQSLVQL